MNREQFEKHVMDRLDIEAIALNLIKGNFKATNLETTIDMYCMETEADIILPDGVEIRITKRGV